MPEGESLAGDSASEVSGEPELPTGDRPHRIPARYALALAAVRPMKSFAKRLSLKELTAEIQRLDERSLGQLTRSLQRSSSAPAAAIAQALRPKLASSGEIESSRFVLNALDASVLALHQSLSLTSDQLSSLFRGEPTDLHFLATHPLRETFVTGPAEFGGSSQVRAAAWTALVLTRSVGSLTALAWLVADPPEFWSEAQRDVLARQWSELREEKSDLPEHPVSLDELCERVIGLERSGQLAERQSQETEEAQGIEEAADMDLASHLSLPDLSDRLTDLTGRYADAGPRALSQLSDDLAHGRVLSPQSIGTLSSLGEELALLLRAVASVAGPDEVGSLEQAEVALQNLSAANATVELLSRISRLVLLEAPAYADDAAQEIRDLAQEADEGSGPVLLGALDALVQAIEIGSTDPERTFRLSGATHDRSLPSAFSMLMGLAGNDGLSLPNGQPEPAGAPAPGEDLESDPNTEIADDVEDGNEIVTPLIEKVESSLLPESSPVAEPAVAPTVEELVAQLGLVVGESHAGDENARVQENDSSRETPLGESPSVSRTDRVEAAVSATVRTGFAEPKAERTPLVRSENARFETENTAPPVSAEVIALHVALLTERRFSLAAWLSHCTGESPVEAVVYGLAAHAQAMRSATGPNAAAFKDLVDELLGRPDLDQLKDLPQMQALLYAASVRAGLISPTAGATEPLRDLCPSISKRSDESSSLTEALLNYLYSGAYLTDNTSNAVAEVADRESEYQSLIDSARSQLENAPNRTIRWAAATELYKAWMDPAGFLGEPLTMVASGSHQADDLRFIRARVAELQSRSGVASAIDRDFPQLVKRGRNRRIEARAREKLIEWVGDARVLMARWVELAESLAKSTKGSWMSVQATELREKVVGLRFQALEAVSDLLADKPGGPVLLDLMNESLDLLDTGVTAQGNRELAPDQVRNGALVLAADLPFRLAPALEPAEPVTVGHVAAAAAALRSETGGWAGSFEQRSRRNDHLGTQVLIELLRDLDPQQSRRLATVRDRDVTTAIGQLDEQVAELTGELDADRRFGRLNEHDWADLSSRTRGFELLSRGQRHDFDQMFFQIDRIREDREKRTTTLAEGLWKHLAALQEDDQLTDEQAVRISQTIADGDITTAEEYFETIRNHGDLPVATARIDHLARFFPAFPTMAGSWPRDRPPVLESLRRTIDSGRNPEQGPLTEVLEGAKMDVSEIVRRSAAVSRLEQWANLSSARSFERLAPLKSVLEQIGFIFSDQNTPRGRSGQKPGASHWMHLIGVRSTEGEALIPAFGSKISPAGDTLRVLQVWKSPTPGQLIQLLRPEPAEHAVLVLYFGVLSPEQRRELAGLMRSHSRLPATIVVDEAAFAYLAAQPTPRLDTTMEILLPFTMSEPFTPDVAGGVAVEMFYGREKELGDVMSMDGPCFVYGGRQLGKSALLRAAAREFEDDHHRRAAYLSIYQIGQGAIGADRIWPTLWPQLVAKAIVQGEQPGGDVAHAVIDGITRWIQAEPGRQLLLLLDESDLFLDADAKGRFTHVDAFRRLMDNTERAVKVVFAGLHQTARFERLANHPLAHFGSPVCVGPLNSQKAFDLLTQPLGALGYRFANDNVAARVLALTNNQPSLIQLFGARMLTHLQRRPVSLRLPQLVTADDVEEIWSDRVLREAIRKRFDWTLNLDHRYKTIAYAVAFHAYDEGIGSALSATELRSDCEQWWPQGFASEDVLTGEFRALLDECVDLGVLSTSATGQYRLRTPNILTLLGTGEEVSSVLDNAASFPLPDSFDGTLLRPRYADTLTRGPLTSAQIADLLRPRNQVRLIIGSEALTLERCVRVLRDENDNAVYGDRIKLRDDVSTSALVATSSAASMWAAGRHALIMCDLRETTPAAAEEVWTSAREAIRERSGGTLGIILIAGPQQAPLWSKAMRESDASSSVTSLHRYENTGLRLWLNETSLPFQDDASRDELLSVTGGWPMLLNRVAESATSGPDPLSDLRDWLAVPANGQRFRQSLGVEADVVVAASWNVLLGVLGPNDAADQGTLVEILEEMVRDPDGHALSVSSYQAAGYPDLASLIDVFRALGVLVANGDGQLRLDQIAAQR
ncbi:hypothetical protein GCM10022223_43130 [Kineosporia mesophila]|uniref:AAA+ ATPase domain-containing protein n=1 Tax=Kineosporia mesophila TaxID=566012 RepID=A0ABP7A1B3_9ACTN|nr:hypothetical protein [Kineosporia mesophila]MCD5353250.1 hypothetical protein [Kineosporia mesophila]